MATKVSLINMKGGVGKSALTVNLAWHFAAYGSWDKKVLVVDLDPQFNASQYLLGVREYEAILAPNKPTIWDVFEQGTRTPSGKASLESARAPIHKYKKFHDGNVIDLIPSRLELAFSLKNPGHKERHLSRLIKEVEADYDLILIDCAPTESVLTATSRDKALLPLVKDLITRPSGELSTILKTVALHEYEGDRTLEGWAGVILDKERRNR